ncbi:MAG: DEAD-box type RNA helicase [Thelocarpon superellum]|nr:MAG: DEAD-box type RNA helicase [Thelocarpon superellum]
MEEITSKLQTLPQGPHWFCPRQAADEGSSYNEPDAQADPERQTRIDEANERANFVIQSLQLLAFQDESRTSFNLWYQGQLDAQLGQCDDCIRRYHQGKNALIEGLRGYETARISRNRGADTDREHADEEVAAFLRILDERDLERIRTGLLRAAELLKEAPPDDRSVGQLDQPSLHAIFEALSADAVLTNDTFLTDYFDGPFNLIQSKRPFRLRHYVPAMAHFLFQPSPSRRDWACRTWPKMPCGPTTEEFAWAIRDPLLAAARRVSSPEVDYPFLEHFWRVVRLIVGNLDQPLITHSFRALDVDIIRLALDHLQLNAPVLIVIVQLFTHVLIRAPADFWDTMGANSPASLVEMICQNPEYARRLEAIREPVDVDTIEEADVETTVTPLLAWVMPFLSSLKLANQPSACRALAAQLMDRLQARRFSEYIRMCCFQAGLEVLVQTLQSFVDQGKNIIDSVSRVVVFEIMEVVSKHLSSILSIAGLPLDDDVGRTLGSLGMSVIKNALTLDCQCLKNDYDALVAGNRLQYDATSSAYSLAIWERVADALGRNDVSLATNILMGMEGEVGLESFYLHPKTSNREEKLKFNVLYGHVTQATARVRGRLADFDPEQLALLFREHPTANALIAGLFAADADTYDAATEVVKVLSSQSGRREALRHLLEAFCATTLRCVTWTIRRISLRETFASNPRMLKTSGDVLEVLCDMHDGLLRTRTLTGPERAFVEAFWTQQWRALHVVFKKMETWSLTNDKDNLREFCRDAIQFAEKLFDEFSLFASAVGAGLDDADASSVADTLLRHPMSSMNAVVKWLRLRDEFLASTLVSMVCKVLRRLGEQGLALDPEALRYIEEVALRGSVRTILPPHEKAELAQALEEHETRRTLSLSTIGRGQSSRKPRQGTLLGWASEAGASTAADAGSGRSSRPKSSAGVIDLDNWAAKAQLRAKTREVIPIADDDDLDEYGHLDDEDILAASHSLERYKAMQRDKAKRAPSRPAPAPTRAPYPSRPRPMSKFPMANAAAAQDFRDKREKERREKAARDQAQIALLRKTKPTSEQRLEQNGIGVPGKDHAPARSEMMVSSDSEPDEDEEALHRATITGAAPPGSRTFREIQESKSLDKQALARAGPVKKTKQIRNAKDMRARLAPDLSGLHQIILGWDFFHYGDLPPDAQRQDYSMVSQTFKTPSEYQATFAPLHVLEAWNGLASAREEGNSLKTFEIKIATRMTLDSFNEIGTSMSMVEGKELGLAEADLVLISKGAKPLRDSDEPHCLARVSKVSRRKKMMEIAYKVTLGNPLVSSMAPNATLRGVRITSLTPLEREYGALRGLQFYDLCEEIIRARPSPILSYDSSPITRLRDTYQVNPAQARAIKSAIDNDGFTLIQGPPGSGKTKTITAIVGAILPPVAPKAAVPIARPQVGGASKAPVARPPSRKLLVCAPSNAAVDELAMRLKAGVTTLQGTRRAVALVRLGRVDIIDEKVKDVTLEQLVNAKLSRLNGDKTSHGEEIHQLVEECKRLGDSVNVLHGQLETARKQDEPGDDIPRLQRELEVQRRKKIDVGRKLDELRDRGDTVARDSEIRRRQVQQEILDEADVICATLSGSGHDMFQHLSIEFETVIIDEAAQSVELSALIPLKYGCAKCILVGDPKQLPPTVLSRAAASFQYEQSLFVRMQSNHPTDVHLLDIQYRMHPEISHFPSQTFYDGRLVDGNDMATVRRRPWHATTLLSPYRFFDVQGLQQRAQQGHSFINTAEINVALSLFARLTADYSTYDFAGKVGIITPYKSQLKELRARFVDRYGQSIFDRIEFNTTDAFQGRECEIIIFSCVRASPNQGIGFLADIRRMNVGLTRAKSSLWVLGNSQSLAQHEYWGRLVEDSRARGRHTQGDLMAILRKPTVRADVEMTDAPAIEPSTTERATMSGSSTRKMKCRRCGATDHVKASCRAERCSSCGEVGHTKGRCVQKAGDASRAKEVSKGKVEKKSGGEPEPRVSTGSSKVSKGEGVDQKVVDGSRMKFKEGSKIKVNDDGSKVRVNGEEPGVKVKDDAASTTITEDGKRKRRPSSPIGLTPLNGPGASAPVPLRSLPIKPENQQNGAGPTLTASSAPPTRYTPGPMAGKPPPPPRVKKAVDPFIRPKPKRPRP